MIKINISLQVWMNRWEIWFNWSKMMVLSKIWI